jgi:hypothetical protein
MGTQVSDSSIRATSRREVGDTNLHPNKKHNPWNVTGFTIYVLYGLDGATLGANIRFAVFSAAGDPIVAPTPVTLTDTGLTYSGGTYKIFKLEILNLTIDLNPGEYWLRLTNTQWQSMYPAYGAPSAQSLPPGILHFAGSDSVEALLSTTTYQRSENGAFQVHGINETVFEDGFE